MRYYSLSSDRNMILVSTSGYATIAIQIFGYNVETQISMGTYRPYRKTLYWTCCSAAIFAYFAFCISHFRIIHISHFSRISHISHISRFHSSHFVHSHILWVSRFRVFHISHFMFSHSCIFCALTHATARLPRIHRIPFACPVLILQGPLVRISLCFTRITSYMSLHSHLCSLILLCIYITSPLYI